MEDMAAVPIFWRSQRAYFRKRVPQDLVQAAGKKEILKSLNTTDKTEAKKQWAIENAKAEAWFADLRERQLLANDNPDQLSAYDEGQLAGLALRWLDQAERKRFQQDAKNRTVMTESEWHEWHENLQMDLGAIREANKVQDTGPGRTLAATWLSELGVTYDRQADAFEKLGMLMNEAILKFTQNRLKQAQGFQVVSPANFSQAAGQQTPHQKIGKAITLEALFEEYMNDPARSLYKTRS